MDCKQALDTLKAAFIADPDYAQGWHSNIACAAMDEGLDYEAANRAASRFMKLAFGVETAAPMTTTKGAWPHDE